MEQPALPHGGGGVGDVGDWLLNLDHYREARSEKREAFIFAT